MARFRVRLMARFTARLMARLMARFTARLVARILTRLRACSLLTSRLWLFVRNRHRFESDGAGWSFGVVGAEWAGPGEGSVGGLDDGPFAVVLESVVSPAEVCQVRAGRWSAERSIDGVVDVATNRWCVAAGESAVQVSCSEELFEFRVRSVGVDGEHGAGVGVDGDLFPVVCVSGELSCGVGVDGSVAG